jgi:outer membrane protein
VLADGTSGQQTGVPEGGLAIGASLSDANPGYVGYHSEVLPVPLVSYRTGRFFLAGPTAGVVASQGDHYTVSFMLLPELMRLRSSASPVLSGLGSRQWTIDGGMNVSFRDSWGDVSLGAFHDILDRNNGTQIRFQYSYPIPLGSGQLSPGVGLTWESANYTNYYYGVTTEEALPIRRAYSPGPALNPSVRLDYTRPLSKTWRMSVGASYMRFDQTIRNSPLIDEPQTYSFRVSLVRLFSGK